MPDPNSVPLFRCKSCFALYQVVKTQAGPETVDPQIACRVCNGPLAAREGHLAQDHVGYECREVTQHIAALGFATKMGVGKSLDWRGLRQPMPPILTSFTRSKRSARHR